MARRHQWHSARDGEQVHHDHEDCPGLHAIDYYWLRHGHGGRPLCDTCGRLGAADRLAAPPVEPAHRHEHAGGQG